MPHNSQSPRPKLRALMETLARGRQDLSLRAFDASQIRWMIQSGLGPACFHAAKQNPENLISAHWSSLKAADLTARMIAADHADALREIIDAAEGYVSGLTLLKGISLASEYYPEFHLRPMRDMDVLVPGEHLARMETLLHDLGYKPQRGDPSGFYKTHHHLMPFFHEEKRVWVEVHHHLLSDKNRASRDSVFDLANVMAQIRRSTFDGRTVHRLSAEFHSVYVAAHWAQDFKAVGGMIAALDLMHLLNRTAGTLCWDTIFTWVQDSTAATYLFLLVSYLDRLRLISLPDEVLQRLFRIQRFFGKLSLKTAHFMMDRYMLDGKDFGAVLTRRNLSVAWNTLMLPVRSPCKLLLMPVNLSMPSHFRIQ